MRKYSLLALGMVIVLCAPPRLAAQVPGARSWADSTTYVIGDPIAVHVEITHPEKSTLTPLLGDTLGSFHILSRDSMRTVGGTSFITFTIAAYDSGTAILPPLQFAYTVPPDSTIRTVATNPLLFTIRLVEVDTTKEIRDIKPVLGVPLTLAEISLILGTVTGVALLVYSLYTYKKRKKERAPVEKYVPPPKAAHIVALEELAELKEKRLWQQSLIKPYYSEVTEIIRRYFENRFGFMSLEKTTDETMDDLRRFPAAHSALEPTDRILRRADLVKFAKYQPTIPEHEEMLSTAYDIIERTRVMEASGQTDTTSEVPRTYNTVGEVADV